MATNSPGLEPRKLEAEVAINVPEQATPTGPTASEQPSADPTVEAHAPDSTGAPEDHQGERVPDAPQEEALTNRAQQRIESLASAKAQAEARAAQAEAMLQRLVNHQLQPSVKPEEQLAAQFKSYNPQLGYPEDPREFVAFNQQQAVQAAQQAALQAARQQAEQADIQQTLASHPEVATDTVLQALVAAKRAEALRSGTNLTYLQATNLAKQELGSKVKHAVTASQVEDTRAKQEAYVETTKGASPGRQPSATPSADTMNLEDMERYLKQTGEWNKT